MLPFHRWQSNHHEFRRHHMVSHRNANKDMRVQTCLLQLTCVLTLRALPQCTVGHRDEPADHSFLWAHWRCHEPVPVAWPPHFCVRGLRRLGQTVGHQGQHVPADFHRPRVGHQRHLCEYDQRLAQEQFRDQTTKLPITAGLLYFLSHRHPKYYSICKNDCLFSSKVLIELCEV